MSKSLRFDSVGSRILLGAASLMYFSSAGLGKVDAKSGNLNSKSGVSLSHVVCSLLGLGAGLGVGSVGGYYLLNNNTANTQKSEPQEPKELTVGGAVGFGKAAGKQKLGIGINPMEYESKEKLETLNAQGPEVFEKADGKQKLGIGINTMEYENKEKLETSWNMKIRRS